MKKKYGARAGLKSVDTGARKVAPTYGGAAFNTFGEKGGDTLVFENFSERLMAHILGLDPRVRRFSGQPFAVDLVEGRLLRTREQRDAARRKYAGRKGASLYTPDFLVEFSSGRLLVLEVKLQGMLGNEADHERLLAATGLLATNGYDVARVVLPSDTTHPLHSNIQHLHFAALRPDLRPDVYAVSRINDLAEKGARTLADFIAGSDISKDLIPSFIVHGALSADVISQRIQGRMPMAPAYGTLDHLQLLERLTS